MVTSVFSLHASVVADLSEKLSLADQIASRLGRRYTWIDGEDLRAYAFLGVTLAVPLFDAGRGLTFLQFAARKGQYLAIDEMRKDGLIRRADSAIPPVRPLGDYDCSRRLPRGRYVPSDGSGEEEFRLIEARDFCQQMLKTLRPVERRLVLMYYVDGLKFGEIAEVLGVSESAICLRHKAIMDRLQRLVAASGIC